MQSVSVYGGNVSEQIIFSICEITKFKKFMLHPQGKVVGANDGKGKKSIENWPIILKYVFLLQLTSINFSHNMHLHKL